MKKLDKVIDPILIAGVFLCVISLIIIKPTEAHHEATTEPTTAETTEYKTEPTETEVPTEEVTEPMETTEATETPVTLYDVPLDQELQLHIISEAEAHNIDPVVIMAMAWKESTYRPNAIGDGGNSYGLLQIQARWHSGRMNKLGCSDLLDPYQNVTVAIDYLAENLNRYGSIEAALVAYNQGYYGGSVTNYARSILAKAETIRSEAYVLFR